MYYVLCAKDGTPMLVEETFSRAEDRYENDPDKYHAVWSVPDWAEDPSNRKVVLGRVVIHVEGLEAGEQVRLFAAPDWMDAVKAREDGLTIEAMGTSTDGGAVRFLLKEHDVSESWGIRLLALRYKPITIAGISLSLGAYVRFMMESDE